MRVVALFTRRMRWCMLAGPLIVLAGVAAFWLSRPVSTINQNQIGTTRAEVSPKDRRAFTTADSWYSPQLFDLNFVSLAKDRFAPVTEVLQPEAQAVLVKLPVKQISGDEAARFSGKKLPSYGVFVLLRAVVLVEGTGGFDVGVSDKAVRVYHGCLGRHAVPMTRKALVAALPRVPEVVYVSCSMAE